MTQLLPPNSTPIERAIDDAGDARFAALRLAVRSRWNPQTCPAEWLGVLAWALSVDTWRSDWPEATKRAVIAASPRVHRLKGTVAAVRTAVEAFGFPARVIEWFSAEGQTLSPDPYTAVIEAQLAAVAARSGSELVEDLLQAAEAAAPARVRLSVRLSAESRAGVARIAHVRRPVTVARFAAEVAA